MLIKLRYGKGEISAEIPEDRILTITKNNLSSLRSQRDASTIIKDALASPISSPKLRELAKGKKNVVIIASDHTRPVPSRAIIPAMLEEIREGSPKADITILIATGCHRGTTKEELFDKFGPEICSREHIIIHDSEQSETVDLGILPSGAPLFVNKTAVEADLLVSEGFIEPHFFAGFSGGRKSVLPGICSTRTVFANHSSSLIDSPYAKAGILLNNPIHMDMVEGARRAGLKFIVNAVINEEHETVAAFAGDYEKAHLKGAEYVLNLCETTINKKAGIVITGNGGYPLDQNIYQTVKALSAADTVAKKGGVIIVCAQCIDGHGGESFYSTFASGKKAEEILYAIRKVPMEETRRDQWQSQIMAKVMAEHRVILVSSLEPSFVEKMGLISARSLTEAIEKADSILSHKEKILVVPDGIGTILQLNEKH